MIFFKTATMNDARSLAALVNSAYRGDSSKAGWTTEADLLDGQRTDPDNLKEIIQTPGNQIEMALDEKDHLLGCVHVKFEDLQTLYFGMLTVSPTLQSKGLGKELIVHIESLAHQRGISKIRISVIQYRKELIAFYERRGFRATGKFEDFPAHDPKFGLPKVQDLKLLEFEKIL